MKKFVIFSLLMVMSFFPFTRAFASDDITGIALEKEVRAMADAGIIKGYSEGVYGPHDKVTRAQFATFIARALHLPDGEHVFTDVAKEATLAKGINAAAAAKIVNGYSPTTFKPNEFITRGQIALMINNTLNYLNIEAKEAEVTFIDQSSFSPAAKVAISNMVGHKITAGYIENNGYSFKPQQTATRAEAAAFIYRMLQLLNHPAEEEKDEEVKEDNIKEEVKEDEVKEEEPVKLAFQIATVNTNGALTYSSTSYETFEAADKAIQNSATQVIVKDGKILKMGSGIAFTTPSNSNYTTLYNNSGLSSVYGGVSKTNELEYVTSDEKSVTVKAAGQTVYVKHEQVTLFPSQSISDRTYYTKRANGDLLLRRYDHVNKKYLSTSTVGKAPSSFAVDGTYYSWDGATFTDKNGNSAGTHYQYFNMLPIRTSTNYTAEELDRIIMKNLETREGYYTSNPTSYVRYKDATKKSKLIGLGSKLKEIEAEHKINALLVLGFAISESDFGMSSDAQRLNNLFGIEAYDDRAGDSKSFATPEESILRLANAYINKNYLPVTGFFPNGGVLGNKAKGMNVRYATDPYWGQIIAGHVYLLDQALGGKDFVNNPNPYKLYLTNTSGLNVRSSAGVLGNNKLFTYTKAGYPVAVIEQEGDWSKILSDNNTDKYGFVSSQYITPMNIAR